MKKLNFDKNRVFTDASIDRMLADMLVFDYVIIVNGCSPSIFPDFVASQATGDFYLACARHDLAYWLGGNFLDKEAADKRFKQDMGKAASYKEDLNFIRYTMRKHVYYELVHLFGDGAFNHWMRKGGKSRGHLPSFDIDKNKPRSAKMFEYKHMIKFEVRHLDKFAKRVKRWVLTIEDFEKVKDIKFKLI